jgi:hypothetical protein
LIAVRVVSLIVDRRPEGQLGELLALNKVAVARARSGGCGRARFHAPLVMPFHLLFNMYALWLAGPIVEQLYGRWRFLVFYLVFAAGGSLLTFALGDARYGVGASGAVFGLFGLLFASQRIHHPVLDRGSRAFLGQLGGLLAINLLFGILVAGIDNFAPSRLIAGLWLSVLVSPNVPPCAPCGPPGRCTTVRLRAGSTVVISWPACSLLGFFAVLRARPRTWSDDFAVVHGPWPRATLDGVDVDALDREVDAGRADRAVLRDAVERLAAEVVALQVDAGIELVTDGQVRWPDLAMAVVTSLAGDTGADPLLDAWRATAALTDRPVAQAVPGPYSMGRRAAGGSDGQAKDEVGEAARRDRTLALAESLALEVRALAEAGCPVILVEEPAAVDVGDDDAERALFVDAQRRLLVPDRWRWSCRAAPRSLPAGRDPRAPYRSFCST